VLVILINSYFALYGASELHPDDMIYDTVTRQIYPNPNPKLNPNPHITDLSRHCYGDLSSLTAYKII